MAHPPTSHEPTDADNPPPPRRADWTETRQRILDAATNMFARNGYRRTNTVDLAQAAGVAETTLFRHFPTKAQLFEEAVITTLHATVAELTERRRSHTPDVSTEDASYDFYDEILQVLREDAGLLIAALAALTFEAETTEFTSLTRAFSELLDYLDEIMRRRAAERNFKIDPVIGGRMMLALTLGVALGDKLIFDDATRPDHNDLALEMARFTAHGLPGASQPGPR